MDLMDLILLIYLSLLVCAKADNVEFNITESDRNKTWTLYEGNHNLVLNYFERNNGHTGNCHFECISGNINLIKLSCHLQQNIVHAQLDNVKITKAYVGLWICRILFYGNQNERNNNGDIKKMFTFNVAVISNSSPVSGSEATTDLKWYIAVPVVIILLLVVIAQTMCVLYFRSKARKAEINMNLTPRNNAVQQLTARYEVRPKSKKNSIDEVRESVMYEALDTIKDAAPPPPPIETLPGTPRVRIPHWNSQSSLAMRQGDLQTRTTPRPQPNDPSNKFNTVHGSSSLKRIENRPRLPLPNPEEEYEIMERDEAIVLPKPTNHIHTFETSLQPFNQSKPKKFFGQTPPVEKKIMNMKPRPYDTQDINNSPSMMRKQMQNIPQSGQNRTFTGQSETFTGKNTPSGQRGPNTLPKPPPTGPKGPIPGSNTSFTGQKVPFTGQNTPAEPRVNLTGPNRPNAPYAPNWRSPIGAGSQRPNLEPIPVLPCMTPPVNLRPVKHLMKPPAEDTPRMSPAQSFTNIATRTRPLPPSKPKPPIPIPVETIGPSDDECDPRATWGEEWTYEALPEYRVYGNVPPVKRHD